MSTTTNNKEYKGTHPSHHFDSVEQEYESCKQGIWLFLATELLMFGGLFVAYAIFRGLYPDIFTYGSEMLDVSMGAVNTAILITSSFTMAMAIHYIQTGKPDRSAKLIWFTIFCALAFLVIKYFEYTHKFAIGAYPGKYFTYEGGPEGLSLFFSIYFMMTGLHAIHILIGIALMFWLLVRIKRGDFGPEYYTPVDGVGLYWHIVDVIWIYLFPLMYLVG